MTAASRSSARVLRGLSLTSLLALAACSVGPTYEAPSAAVPMQYKEQKSPVKGWKVATPRDAAPKGAWWSVFRDPVLNRLVAQVEVSNQSLKQAEAAYRQATAIIREAQAGLFPTLNGGYDASRARNNSRTAGASYATSVSVEASAGWDLDLWGRIRRSVESNAAGAQASEADLANATLAAQAQLATAYFNLRATDSLHSVLTRTAAEYQRTVDITQNQYNAGTAARSDVITATTQLKNTQAQAVATQIQRAQYEHAIAVLIGRPPAELSIGRAQLGGSPPAVPATLPSSLLERRPDIAAAERRMQQQNAQIGVATAALYPDISLSAVFGFNGRRPLPVSAASEIWSIAASASQSILGGGLRTATIDAARAGYDESVAAYRQTVLSAFQQVEDQLSTLNVLAQQGRIQGEALSAARQAVQINLNEYRAGTIPFTTVVAAQATLLGAEEAALAIRQNRFVATVALIQALGGGFQAQALVPIEVLTTPDPAAILRP